MTFQDQILQGIPSTLPPKKQPNLIFRTPKAQGYSEHRGEKVGGEKCGVLFPQNLACRIGDGVFEELQEYGRIYMYRFMPEYECMPGQFRSTLPKPNRQCHHADDPKKPDPAVAQHPQELITYGGNGAVFKTGPSTC